MDYQIVLHPDLGLSPSDFICAWNEEEETSTKGEAYLASSESKTFDPALMEAIVLSITTGIVSSALYDLIKRVLAKKGVKHTHIEEIKRPDGTHWLRVDIEEK